MKPLHERELVGDGVVEPILVGQLSSRQSLHEKAVIFFFSESTKTDVIIVHKNLFSYDLYNVVYPKPGS